MVSAFTTNLSVEKPGSGDYVGTWDAPVNSNMGVFDTALGTVQAISLAAGSVTLSTAQVRSAFLNFTGALPGNVTVTVPSLSSSPGTIISGRYFTMQNQCSNSSVATITIASTVAGQESICLPPYEAIDILMEGTNSSQAGSIKYKSLGHRVGQYWDYAGSSVPNWVSGCTKPPYLNCDGTTFSSATYPALTVVLGSTTLPDARGRYRATLNQGTARLSTAAGAGGIDGNTRFATGGTQTVTIGASNVPVLRAASSAGTVTLNSTYVIGRSITNLAAGGTGAATDPITIASTGLGMIVTVNSTTANAAFAQLPPSYVGGLTLIRAA